MLGRHIRREGIRLIERQLDKLASLPRPSVELPTQTIGRLHARKLHELTDQPRLPDANIPKIVSFPAT